MKLNSTIRAIELEGFQTFKRPTRIEFADLTLLYGPNSAGKSAILDAFEVFRAATDIKNFDPRKLFTCVDRWSSWLSTDRWNAIYEAEKKGGSKNPAPIRTMTLSAEFDLEIVDPYEISEDARIKSFRHRQRQLSFGGEDFVYFAREFGKNSLEESIAKITLTFTVRGKGENAFDEDFFLNFLEIELGGKKVARLSTGDPHAEEDYMRAIPEDGLLLVLYETPFTDKLLHSYTFGEPGLSEIVDRYRFKVGEMNGLRVNVSLPWQNYFEVHHRYDVNQTDFDPLLVNCCVDVICYFFGGLHEILEKTQCVTADRKIPELAELTSTVEMGYTQYWWDKTASSETAPLTSLRRSKPTGISYFEQLAIAGHCEMLKRALDNDEWGSDHAREQITKVTSSGVAKYNYLKESLRFEKVNGYLANELFKESGYQLGSSSVLLVPLDLSMEDVYHAGYILLQDAQVTVFLMDVNGKRYEFKDVGSGISFVLPVLVSLTSEGIRFIQQPELHLHPALQASLADVFIDTAKGGGSLTIIETHSEHFLLRLLRRIRRTGQQKERAFQLSPEEVAVYYFDPQIDGETIVTRQLITPLGDFFHDWPRGFFADRDQDLLDGRL